MLNDIINKYGKTLYLDNLTKTYSRSVIIEYCTKLIELNKPFSICIIDIDNFKSVNDTFGHAIGDIVIKTIADKICEVVGDKGIVGRFGGDEFLLVYENTDYNKIWDLLHDVSFGVNDISFPNMNNLIASVTTGAARFPLDAPSYEELFVKADKALYRGKQKGRNCFIIYLEEKHKDIIKDKSDKSYNTMYLYSKLYSYLTRDDFFEGIKDLLKSILDYYLLDHICINTSNKLIFDIKANNISNDFMPICEDLISSNTDLYGLVSFNFIDTHYTTKLKEEALNQDIHGLCYIRIDAYGKNYGYLRIDSLKGNGRIWQPTEINLFINVAKTIGLIMYYKDLSFK